MIIHGDITDMELRDLIVNRMVQKQAVINRLEYWGNDPEELSYQKGGLAELRFIKNMIELRYA